MLAFKENGQWQHWTGQLRPLNGEGGYQLPRNADALYSAADLADYGLRLVTLADVPEGKRVASWTLGDDAGKPVQLAVLEDLPPPSAAEMHRQNYVADADRLDLVARLRAATPAQIDTHIENNVTNLAQARAYLKKLTKVVALLIGDE